jgi:hypothetical protein
MFDAGSTTNIDDYVILAVPDDVDTDDPEVRQKLDDQAQIQIYGQYRKRRPKALLLDDIDWLITSDPDDVERHQPAHDCANCKAGNRKAQEYLRANPGKRLALGNLHYVEIW